MSEQVQLDIQSPFKLGSTTLSQKSSSLEVGDILTGTVVDKQPEGVSVMVEQKIAKLSGDVKIVEEVGEQLRLEVIKITEETIQLKYLQPERSTKESRSIRDDQRKSIEIPDTYKKALIKAGKILSPDEMSKLNQMVKTIEDKLTILADTMTDRDVKEMMATGMNPIKMSVDMMTEVLTYHKSAVRNHDMEALSQAVDKTYIALSKGYNNEEQLKAVVHALKENHLPATKQQVDKVLEAIEKTNTISETIDDKWMNVLKGAKDNTLKEVYKAVSLPALTKRPLQIEPDVMNKMVESHLSAIEVKPTAIAKEAAITLMAYDLPVTKENIDIVLNPSHLLLSRDEVSLIEDIVTKIAKKESPTGIQVLKNDSPIIEHKSMVDKPMDAKLQNQTTLLVQKVLSITNEQVISATNRQTAVESQRSKDLTIDLILEEPFDGSEESVSEKPKEILSETALKNLRHMTEIRLRMTVSAALRLQNSGIKIESRTIEALKDDLKALDEETYTAIAKGHQVKTEAIQQVVEVVDTTMMAYKKMRLHTDSVSTQIVQDEGEMTMRTVIKSVETLYEQNMTQVRRDLGDRVEKTFNQLQPMLESLNIEVTPQNLEAGEILARNAMPITEENILNISLIQQKVAYVTTKMNPHLVLEMVKAGITPMDLSLDDTIELMDIFDEKFGETQAEKISRLIHNLTEDGTMTKEQKESLMGIYRTFDTVVRSKGAATGFAIKNQLPLTIETLFEAAKYIKKSGLIKQVVSVDVDDAFGTLASIKQSSKPIKEQVKAAIEAMKLKPDMTVVKAYESIEDEADLTKVKVLSKALMDMTLKQMVSSMSHESLKTLHQENGDKSLKEMPLAELEKLLRSANTKEEGKPVSAEGMTRESMQIEAALRFIKQQPNLVKMMIKDNIEITPENLMKAVELNKEPFELLIRLREMMNAVDDTETLTKLQHKIGQTAEEILSGRLGTDQLKTVLLEVENALASADKVPSEWVSEQSAENFKTLRHTQMIQISHDYYQIPMTFGQTIGQLNMYILNDRETTENESDTGMEVVMQFKTQNLGKVTAYLNIQNEGIKMNLQSEYSGDQALLKSYKQSLIQIIEESDYHLVGLSYDTMTVKDPVHNDEDKKQKTQNGMKNGHFETIV